VQPRTQDPDSHTLILCIQHPSTRHTPYIPDPKP
jgi:hypothetical protein